MDTISALVRLTHLGPKNPILPRPTRGFADHNRALFTSAPSEPSLGVNLATPINTTGHRWTPVDSENPLCESVEPTFALLKGRCPRPLDDGGATGTF
jgi:hypothetical protein